MPPTAIKSNVTIFKQTHSASRGASSYQSDDASGTIYLSRNAFNGKHPATLAVMDVPAAEPKSSARTPEQRKAALAELRAKFAAMTPAQRAQTKLDAAQAKLDKAKAAALKVAGPETISAPVTAKGKK